jgi:dihydroorotase
MEIIIRAARIIDTGSPFHNQVKDILVSNGRIKKIASKIQNTGKAREIKSDNLHVSLGWVDMNTFLADPGFEHKETIETGCAAAAFGGFTHICAMPNTLPVTQTKSQIEYIIGKSASQICDVHPVGAVSQNCEGKELAEMYDMYKAGAIAFSDGLTASPSAGMVERALLYVKAFDGLVMNHPEEKSVSKNGVMHEGITSTRLGLPASPGFAEEIAVNRDLYVLEYTDSKLHFLDISLKKSVDLIRTAKKKGLKVSASVNAYNLLLEDTAIGNYNTYYKVNPHLRSKEDLPGLAKGLADGTLDTITSAHQPQDEECKKLEFDKADFGMIGLETCFAVANTALKDKVDISVIISALSNNPRKLLHLENKIEEGAMADLTFFNPGLEWVFTSEYIQSRSSNSPFLGTSFIGKPLGVLNNGKIKMV